MIEEHKDHIYIRLPADNVKEGPIPNTYIVDLGPADTLMMMVLGAMANPGNHPSAHRTCRLHLDRDVEDPPYFSPARRLCLSCPGR